MSETKTYTIQEKTFTLKDATDKDAVAGSLGIDRAGFEWFLDFTQVRLMLNYILSGDFSGIDFKAIPEEVALGIYLDFCQLVAERASRLLVSARNSRALRN